MAAEPDGGAQLRQAHGGDELRLGLAGLGIDANPVDSSQLRVLSLTAPVAMGYIPLGMVFGFLFVQAGGDRLAGDHGECDCLRGTLRNS